jgi:hypothetical protein
MTNPDFHARVARINHLMLDKLELVLDVLKRQYDPPPPLTPLEASVWRWTNNRLDVQNFCDKPACRRARSCKGEPRACLTRHAPKIPPATAKQAVALGRAIYSPSASAMKAFGSEQNDRMVR